MLYVIFFFIFGGFAVFFAKQNCLPVDLKLFSMEFSTTLDVVMVVSFIVGGILVSIFAFIQQIKMASRARILKKQTKKLEGDVASLEKTISELRDQISYLEVEAVAAMEAEVIEEETD